MSYPHHSHGIPLSVAIVLLLSVGGCTVSNQAPQPAPTPAPSDTAPQPAPPPYEGSQTATYRMLPFTSPGEQNVHEIEQYQKEVRCLSGNGSKGSPLICVDNNSIRPDPYAAPVWDFQGQNGQLTNRPVVVHWFTRREGDLQISFKPAANGKQCVRRPVCSGNGHCSAVVLPLEGEESRTCEYSVWIDGQILDKSTPELAVNPCCW